MKGKYFSAIGVMVKTTIFLQTQCLVIYGCIPYFFLTYIRPYALTICKSALGYIEEAERINQIDFLLNNINALNERDMSTRLYNKPSICPFMRVIGDLRSFVSVSCCVKIYLYTILLYKTFSIENIILIFSAYFHDAFLTHCTQIKFI